MPVLERAELEASPLADLHAIADQLGLEGFRRLRKAELIDAILGESGGARDGDDAAAAPEEGEEGSAEQEEAPGREARTRRRRAGRSRRRAAGAEGEPADGGDDRVEGQDAARVAEGVVEVLGNGSAFLRVDPPEPSDDDVYISAAQVRRCELVSGDRVIGPVRTPRRSERYPSLVRIDTINGESAETVSAGTRYDELAVTHPTERLALGVRDATLEAIEWLTPVGLGSRAVITGPRHAGKTETLRKLLAALHDREGLEVILVLVGARPEEIAQWSEGPAAPAAALNFAASADSQDQAVERAVETAKRIAARGGNALLLIDTLDGLHPHGARKALAAARNLRDGGSVTIIATATRPFGGESTVIALDAALTATGREPILDLTASGTLRPELLVGADGAAAITSARAGAIEG